MMRWSPLPGFLIYCLPHKSPFFLKPCVKIRRLFVGLHESLKNRFCSKKMSYTLTPPFHTHSVSTDTHWTLFSKKQRRNTNFVENKVYESNHKRDNAYSECLLSSNRMTGSPFISEPMSNSASKERKREHSDTHAPIFGLRKRKIKIGLGYWV